MANSLMIYTSSGYIKFRGTADGQIPVWNVAADEWQLGTGGGGGGGSGTVTSVTLATGSTGLTVSGLTSQTITASGTFTLAGILGVGYGGTGLNLSSITDGKILIGQSTGSFAAQSLSVDATMDKDGKVKVTGLQNVPLSATAPVAGQMMQYDGTNWSPGQVPAGGSGGGGLTYYFNYGTTTGISPTSGLPTTPVAPSLLGRSHVANATPVTSGDLVHDTMSLVCGFVTSTTDPAVTNIPAGLWDFNIWASAPDSTAVNQTAILAKVYRYRSSDSSYLQLGISDPVYLYDLATRAQYILSVVVQQTTILATDRIYIELWAQKTANPGQLRRVMFYFEADAPTHVHTTLPSVSGTGIAHVVDGVFQSPATPISLNSGDTSGQLPAAKGGTGQSSYAQGDMLYAATANPTALSKMPVGSAGQVMTVDPDTLLPVWKDNVFAATVAYDLCGATEGTYLNGQVVTRTTTVRPIFFPAIFNGVFKAKTLSTGTVNVTMSAVGYGTICTAQFTSGSLTATVTAGALTGIPAGTDIIVTMPATADATLAGVYWSVFASVIPSSVLSPADLSGGSLGTYLNGEVIYRLIAVRTFELSNTSTDHVFRCITGPAAAGGAVVTVAIDGGATIMTASFAQNATTGTVTLSNTSIPVGSVITVTMPATADASFASLYFTMKGEA